MSLKLQVIFNFLSKFSLQLNIFILSIILVRYLDKSTYGTYLQFQLCVNTGIYMFTLGIPHSIYYFYSKAINRQKYMLACMGVLVCLGVLIALAINAGDFVGEWLNNSELNKYTLLIGIAIICLLPYEMAEPFLISAKRGNYFSILNAAFGMLFFLVILGSLYLEAGLGEMFTAITALYVIQFFLLLVLIFRHSHNDNKANVAEGPQGVSIRQVARYCLPISLQVMIGKMSGMLDRYVISASFTPSQFAVYSRGATHLPIIDILPYSMSNVLFPSYTEYHNTGRIDMMFSLWRKAIVKVALLVYPIFAFFCVFSPDFIIILYTEQYSDSIPIFQVYLATLLIKLAISDTLMRVAGKTSYMPYIAGISLLTNLLLALVLLKLLGIIGPAIATIFVVFLNAYLCMAITKKIYSVKWRDMIPWLDLGKILFVSMLAVLPLFLIKDRLLNFFEFCFAFGVYVSLFAILALLFKLTTIEEIKQQYLLPMLNKYNRKR